MSQASSIDWEWLHGNEMDGCTELSLPHCSHCRMMFKRQTHLGYPACAGGPLLTRYSCLGYCPLPNMAQEAMKNFKNSLDIAGIPVLARRETDGYYYPGTVIKGAEKQDESKTVLVRFAKPFAEDEETCVQRTACSDILEYVNGMRHSILPGDKVLAPWESGEKRYGPGTVIQGLETRDPLREKEDEEITVSFWNGKKIKVPLGVSLWISPRKWEKIVEMIHSPLASRKQFEGQLHRCNYSICSCGSILAPTYKCTLSGFHRFQQPHCSSMCPYYQSFHHACSLCRPTQSVLCSSPKYTRCWWQPSLAERCCREVGMFSDKPTTQLLAVEGPPKEKSSSQKDEETSLTKAIMVDHAVNTIPRDKEPSSTKTIMVDHGVNTDSSLFYKPKVQEIRRPDWKYWKRSHPSSYCKAQGTDYTLSSSSHQQKENDESSYMDISPSTLINQSAIFETIEYCPQRRLTVKEILTPKDIQLGRG